MTNQDIKAMLQENTNMTEHDIKRHINDGISVYESEADYIEEAVAGLIDEEDAAETAKTLEKMTFNGKTYLVDFVL